MVDRGYTLDEASLHRILRAVRKVEQLMPDGPLLPDAKWNATPLPMPPFVIGKLQAAMGPSETKTIDEYYYNGASWVDGGEDRDVVAPPLLSSGSIAISKWVIASYHARSQMWIVTAYEC
jgi:hypothetical protein